jgi:hypothetical protein
VQFCFLCDRRAQTSAVIDVIPLVHDFFLSENDDMPKPVQKHTEAKEV